MSGLKHFILREVCPVLMVCFEDDPCVFTGRLFRPAGLGTWTCSIVNFAVPSYSTCIFTVFADAFGSSIFLKTRPHIRIDFVSIECTSNPDQTTLRLGLNNSRCLPCTVTFTLVINLPRVKNFRTDFSDK